jgi:hypothetical protein
VFSPNSEPLRPDNELGLLSETINRHMARVGRDAPRVVEGMLTFMCLRCSRALSAAQTVVVRKPGEVVYACPDDNATLVTIHADDYVFSDGDLTIRVGAEQVAWWEFVSPDDSDA